MTTARCFGGVLDGRWRDQPDGQYLLAPVIQPIRFSPYIPTPEEVPGFGTHKYTLHKFVVGVTGYRREPIYFHALIGPGFTVAMVKAWLDGWIEEADKLTKEAKMQPRPGDKARAEVAELERRIENQRDYIDEFRAERDEARRQRGVQARRAERAEAALQYPFGPGYAKDRIEALHRMLAGAQEDRQQLQEQRDFFKTRLNAVMDETRVSIRRLTSERDEALEGRREAERKLGSMHGAVKVELEIGPAYGEVTVCVKGPKGWLTLIAEDGVGLTDLGCMEGHLIPADPPREQSDG